MVFERFEVLSAPVEERLADGIVGQAMIVVEALRERFAILNRLASDKKSVDAMTRTAIALVLPGSVPFFLFFAACCLRLLYAALLRLRSRRMLKDKTSLFSPREVVEKKHA